MFTGIIEAVGTVANLVFKDDQARMRVATDAGFSGFEMGESIAVNGVCLTVCDFGDQWFAVDMTTETLNRTSFNQVKEQSRVNLERALTPDKKMSGHFVTGHVDAVARVAEIQPKTGEVLYRFEHPPELSPFLIEKGSAAVDGISLTVFNCRDNHFTVSIIPFTLEHTNLKDRKPGDSVNIECDMIGKYVVRACETMFGRSGEGGGISTDFLKQHGFA
ncbi:MAG: riboflavin synthase [Nitrospinaceae bacterium]|nr:riboflavin synthase [Nitrospinaceae bacterium]NIR57176.1 riboflavin synthase [Nitrospinaceae bacterium]NIS87618.1 riboflavin synthase [Nitrospinaceae bacterium]NIT84489.1 riboflavin synthase [Nitrospinaceae bacterium]NIU46675.1 riboflavin synthase [Nitrospinaceae bacterium]